MPRLCAWAYKQLSDTPESCIIDGKEYPVQHNTVFECAATLLEVTTNCTATVAEYKACIDATASDLCDSVVNPPIACDAWLACQP